MLRCQTTHSEKKHQNPTSHMTDSVQEIIKAADKIDKLCEQLGLKPINGELSIRSGAAIVRIDYSTACEQLTKDIVGDHSLAFRCVQFIQKNEDGIFNENVLIASDLINKPKCITVSIRQGITNTWFQISVNTVYGDELAELLGDESLDDYADDSINQPSDEQLYQWAIDIAKQDGFGRLKNKKERIAFTSSVCQSKFVDCPDDYYQSITSIAESFYDEWVLPNTCRDMEKDGFSVKEMARKLKKTPSKIEMALNTQTANYILEMLAKIHIS